MTISNETAPAHLADPAAPPMADDSGRFSANDRDDGLHAVEPGYRHVLRLQWAMTLLPIVIGAGVLDWFVLSEETALGGLLGFGMAMAALLIVVTTPARQWRNWRYALSAEDLRVMRGYLFHTDTLVPFVRVQHIDVGQGPVERLFGVSHLVVHTAGTDNSIVTLPGLSPARAADMRDTIRQHIKTDFA
jgi:hypothetical protein